MNRYIKCCIGFLSGLFLSYALKNLNGDTIADSTIEFNRDIRPILSEHCFACHGPDKGHREADLRLDIDPTLESKEPSQQPAIVAGDPAASKLVPTSIRLINSLIQSLSSLVCRQMKKLIVGR